MSGNRIQQISRRVVFMILLFAFMAGKSLAQADTTLASATDTLIVESKKEKLSYDDKLEHSPKKAMYYSLFVPGMGQAYNKKYFKIPIIYAAYGGIGYLIYTNNNVYQDIVVRFENGEISETILKRSRRYLEISILSIVAFHALQTVDAYVDAHLFYWDVNKDLSLRVSPSAEQLIIPTAPASIQFGLKCKFTF